MFHVEHFGFKVLKRNRNLGFIHRPGGCRRPGLLMLSHVLVGTNDLSSAVGFYSRVLEPLSLVLRFIEPGQWAGWQMPGNDRPLSSLAGPLMDRALMPAMAR
jgi:hypothetical protein